MPFARRAPHPYAAMLYLDFMLTDAQAILAKRHFAPASTKVSVSPDDALPAGMQPIFLDPAKALDQRQKAVRLHSCRVRQVTGVRGARGVDE